MPETAEQATSDWAGSIRAFSIAWGVPLVAVVAGSLANIPVRSAIWSLALLWMGAACLINARRCGRVHCRYTGPFYLFLIAPVLLQGAGLLSFGPHAWWILGAVILFGGKIIWWGTETAWGRYTG